MLDEDSHAFDLHRLHLDKEPVATLFDDAGYINCEIFRAFFHSEMNDEDIRVPSKVRST